MERQRGKVITFYSYKGGTGRSMALANVACLLSRRPEVKKGILAIDWDLEAPGLHHFFRDTRPSLKNPQANGPGAPSGLVGIFEVLQAQIASLTKGEALGEESAEKLVRALTLTDFVVQTVVPKLELMPAGRFEEDYGERVNALDWRRIFHQAPSLVRLLAEYLADQYDYVIIDSRTGLNDISGICTALLPDQLVLVFTPNHQSLLGGIDIVKKATAYRRQSDDLRPLVVFPLPSRVDVSEPELLEKWRFGDSNDPADALGYQGRFEDLFAEIYELPACNLKTYFDEVQIQHVPRYSYGEDIAALIERGNRLSISRSYAAFSTILTEFESPWNATPSNERSAVPSFGVSTGSPKVQAVKEYLAEDRFRLKLHDLVVQEIREVLAETTEDKFPVQGQWSIEEFALRLHQYEAVCADLLRIQVLLGFWANSSDDVLTLSGKKLCDRIELKGGVTGWLALQWYPALLLLYSGGIAAVAANRYDNLRKLMLTPTSLRQPNDDPTLICSVAREINEIHGAFKDLPGHERQYTPRSEYLFDILRPILDDLLFLSSDYERSFDRFEVLYALEHAHRSSGFRGRWGPLGRFAWKLRNDGSFDPFNQIVAEAKAEGNLWPPIRAGLFAGSVERFTEIADQFGEQIAHLSWL